MEDLVVDLRSKQYLPAVFVGLGALVKLSVDLLRLKIVQRVMAVIETGFGLEPGSLQWAHWHPITKFAVGISLSFVIAFVTALSLMPWPQAILTSLGAAYAGKGFHDATKTS